MSLSKQRKFQNVPDVGDTPNQPKKKFPMREFGKTKITRTAFQKGWFDEYPWIHYDEPRDLAFCFTCIRAYNQKCIANQNIEPRWISEGYSNWKVATRPGRGFKGHETSDCHKEAIERTETLPKCTADVGESLSADHAAEKSIARQALLKILSNVRFLARQALPLRGDNAGEPNSNFNQLYHLRAEENPYLYQWLDRKGDRYTHHEIQNEMMKLMAHQVLREIGAEIRGAEFFSIMVDEATDVSNISQLTLCIRWVDDLLNCYEDFIGLHSLDVANADGIVAVIKDVILRNNLNLKNCRGQCYDGCSTMKGEKNGVASK